MTPPKHAEQDQIDANWLGKKKKKKKKNGFWRESQKAGRSLIIVNKSIKETENLIFQCKIEFYFTHEYQNLYFTATSENTSFGVHEWNKIRSYTEKMKYPL